jgi:hypothetical protein
MIRLVLSRGATALGVGVVEGDGLGLGQSRSAILSESGARIQGGTEGERDALFPYLASP